MCFDTSVVFSEVKNPSLFQNKEGFFSMKASMKNDISVDDLLKKVHQMITYLILLMLLVIFIMSFCKGNPTFSGNLEIKFFQFTII